MGEAKKPHYMRGGVPGKIEQLPFDGIQGLWAPKIKFWDPLNFTGALSAEQKARKRKAELKNGRLAMIGISLSSSATTCPAPSPPSPRRSKQPRLQLKQHVATAFSSDFSRLVQCPGGCVRGSADLYTCMTTVETKLQI